MCRDSHVFSARQRSAGPCSRARFPEDGDKLFNAGHLSQPSGRSLRVASIPNNGSAAGYASDQPLPVHRLSTRVVPFGGGKIVRRSGRLVRIPYNGAALVVVAYIPSDQAVIIDGDNFGSLALGRRKVDRGGRLSARALKNRSPISVQVGHASDDALVIDGTGAA